MKKAGFTLIELLIVVTIIGVLMAIGFISYRQFVRQAEDAQRKADLKFIQSALEQYHADQHYYPQSITFGGALKNPNKTKTYLTVIPQDPGATGYSYQGIECVDNNCKSYCLFAKLNDDSAVADDLGCNLSGDYNWGVTRP